MFSDEVSELLSLHARIESERFHGGSAPVLTPPDNRRAIRERIVKALSNGCDTIRDLEDRLVDITEYELRRELQALIERGAVKHNGKRGLGSRYQRSAA